MLSLSVAHSSATTSHSPNFSIDHTQSYESCEVALPLTSLLPLLVFLLCLSVNPIFNHYKTPNFFLIFFCCTCMTNLQSYRNLVSTPMTYATAQQNTSRKYTHMCTHTCTHNHAISMSLLSWNNFLYWDAIFTFPNLTFSLSWHPLCPNGYSLSQSHLNSICGKMNSSFISQLCPSYNEI